MKKLGEKLMKLYLAIRYAERGATAVEYALMVALIAVVIIVAVTALGQQLIAVFEGITTGLTPVVPPAGG